MRVSLCWTCFSRRHFQSSRLLTEPGARLVASQPAPVPILSPPNTVQQLQACANPQASLHVDVEDSSLGLCACVARALNTLSHLPSPGGSLSQKACYLIHILSRNGLYKQKPIAAERIYKMSGPASISWSRSSTLLLSRDRAMVTTPEDLSLASGDFADKKCQHLKSN